MSFRARMQQFVANLPSKWPVLLVIFGLLFVVTSFFVDGLNPGTSPEFGPRNQRLLILGVFVTLSSILLLFVKGLRERVESWGLRFYTWLYSEHTDRRAWLVAIPLTLILFGLFVAFYYKRYDYIDDPPIRDSAIANVAFLFSANVLRQALYFLYHSFPNLPWYGIALYCSMIISFVIVLYLIITYEGPLWYKVLFFVIFTSLYIAFWMRASYNYASSLLAGVTFILLYFLWKKKPPNLFIAFLLGLLLAVSFIFRRDGVKLGLIFIAPPVIVLLFYQLFLKRISLKLAMIYIFAFVLLFAPYLLIQVFDEYQYKNALSPQEQYHRTSNRSRSEYYGQPLLLSKILKDQQLLDANGWDSNDVVIAEYGMVMLDENKYAADRFWTIFNEEIGLTQEESGKGIGGFIYNLTHFGQLENFKWYNPGWLEWNEHWQYWPYYALMITLTILAIWRGKRYYHKLFAPLLLIYFYFISTYMLNYLRFPRHIAVPPMAFICLALFVCVEIDFKEITTGWHRKLLLSIVGIGMALSFFGFTQLNWQTDQEISVKRAEFVNLYTDFANRFGKDAFIFVRPPLYIDYFVDPLGDQGPENNISYLNVSSTAYSPLFYGLLNQYGLDYGYQVLPWMIDNPKAYFASKEKFLVDRVVRFILETYDIQVEMQPVYTYDDGLVIYKIIGKNSFVSHFEATESLLNELPFATINAPDATYVHPTTMTIDGETRSVLFEHPDSEVTYHITVPDLANLSFGIGFTPEAWLIGKKIGNGVRFNVFVESEGERKLVFTRYIDPKNNRADRRWFDFNVDLSTWSGREVNLIFETQSGPLMDNTNDWAGWSEPEIGQWSYFNFAQKFYLASPTPQSLERLRVRRVKVNDVFMSGIYEHPTNSINYPVKIRPGTLLNFSVGLDPAVWLQGEGDGVQFEIFVTGDDGSTERIYSRYINPVEDPNDRQWYTESIDLSEYSGQDVEITFATSPGPDGDELFDWAYWVNPRLMVAQPEK